jgi:hypothetical protein
MNDPIDSDQILARVSVSAPRRALGLVVLCTLGGGLIYVALARPADAIGWQLFLLVFGAVILALAMFQMKATRRGLELTMTELRETGGRRVAEISQVTRVDRGAFAIKPSNGFLLHLAGPHPDGNCWAPGLWWRVGRRVGIGGITAAGEAKTMAEMVTALAVQHTQKDDQGRI